MAASIQKSAIAGNTSSTQSTITISEARPLQDYQKLIETRVQMDEIVEDAITKENFTIIAAEARDVIWRLLFNKAAGSSSDDSQQKAAELLEEYKGDACFYAPWPYNDWIVQLRDEVLKNKLLDFWRETIVKKQLGPCWSRDSDLFESGDVPPLEFYAHAGCEAPFAASLKARATVANESSAADADVSDADSGLDDVAALSGNFEAHISNDQPLASYRNLMKRFVLVNIIVPDDVHKASVNKIAKAARDSIWMLLFVGTPTQVEFDKAAELLQEYKGDAAFYGPWEYNEWIVKLRDEVLNRDLLYFWREKLVKLELGPCWARDSDFFESDDPVPSEFYDRAGCKAPFDVPQSDTN